MVFEQQKTTPSEVKTKQFTRNTPLSIQFNAVEKGAATLTNYIKHTSHVIDWRKGTVRSEVGEFS